jgi:HEAT repeat protein
MSRLFEKSFIAPQSIRLLRGVSFQPGKLTSRRREACATGFNSIILLLPFVMLPAEIRADDDAKIQVRRLIAAARIYDEREMADAIDQLVLIGRPAIGDLRGALDDFDDNVRWQAIVALGRIGDAARSEIPRIVTALDDIDCDVRAAAAETLAQLGVASPEVIRPLLQRRKDQHGIVRASAHWALWQLQRDSDSVAGLIRELSSPDWIVTDRAVRHLASIGSPAANPLANHLQQRAAGRHHAALALAQMDRCPKSAIPVLIQCLADRDSHVARAASLALGRTGSSAVAPLCRFLETNPQRGQRQAIAALGRIGEPASDAVPLLLIRLSDNDRAVRLSVIQAIGNIGPAASSAERNIAALLEDSNQDIRGAACEALGQLKAGSPQTIAGLRRLSAADSRDFVRQAAKLALAAIESR